MKVSLTLTSYAALFLNVYFTDLSKNTSQKKKKVYLSYTVLYFEKNNNNKKKQKSTWNRSESRQRWLRLYFLKLYIEYDSALEQMCNESINN